MANLPEISEFTAGIYQLEITDPVEGGPSGVSNSQAKALANRTKWLKDNAIGYFPGEFKWLGKKTQAFIDTNFPLGLGTGIYLGWAVANGANGTDDMGGKVAIGQGNGYAIGATGGSKDAVVVSHTHQTIIDGEAGINMPVPFSSTQSVLRQSNNDGDFKYYLNPGTEGLVPDKGRTSTTGVSGTDKNIQPYRVVLCIQKI
jgi:hypothetical protein